MNKQLRFTTTGKVIILATLLVCLLASVWHNTTQAAGPIIYVDTDAASGGDGSSWAAAYTNLDTALAVAAAGDQIWVAQGVYKPGNLRESTFHLVDGVAVYGGFDGTETTLDQRNWEDNVTVLSGDIDNNDLVDANGVVTTTTHIVGSNAYHVVIDTSVSTATRLDGLTITAGKADHISDPEHRRGGGLLGWGSPALVNVTFSGNSAQYGGGLYISSGLALTNVTFTGNSADEGGGVINGGFSTLTNVVFSGNLADLRGGGMSNLSDSRLVNVAFYGNSAAVSGGGMYNYSDILLVNATFSGNLAHNGGGIYNGTSTSDQLLLANVTFSGNLANYGGAINNYRSNPTVVNATLWNNSAGVAGNQIHNDSSSNPTISYSLIQLSGGSGSSWNSSLGTDGGGNIDLDPLFVDADGPDNIAGTLDDNMRLQSTSPAIDAADSTSVPVDTNDLDGDGNTTEILPYDLDNHPRFADMPVPDTGFGPVPIVDMGAYETNTAPIADAGAPQTVPPGAIVTLDGSNSSDPDGHVLTYQWTQTGGASVTLSDAAAVAPTFIAPTTTGDLTFELIITDAYGLSDLDNVTITVQEFCLYLPIIRR